MTPRERLYRAVASVVAVLVSTTSGASADERTVGACLDAHIEGQRVRDAGKLRAARQHFLACASQSCPAPLRKDCAQWLSEAEAAIPTVLVHAQLGGRDTADVAVLVDGERVAPRLTGMPIALDPGEHLLRFVAADGQTREERVVLDAGEKGRRISIELSAGAPKPPETPPPTSSPSTPTSVYVLGAVGVVALGSFAWFGTKALTKGNELEDSCAPTCSADASSEVHRNALIADVSLGVGVVALGAAAWILLTHRDRASAVLAAPTRHGGVVGWQARF